MDTRFWGPDGWLFLHSIMYYLPEKITTTEKKKLIKFIKLTPKILPCKYCRISMSKYIKSLPIEKYAGSKDRAIEWIYRLHNKVNNKLRRQGYCITDNPTLDQVNDIYREIKLYLEQSSQFTLNNSNLVRKVKRTKKVKKGYQNFDNKIKTYTKQEIILCNNFIGSIIFNFPNILANSYKNNTSNLKDLISLYEEYLSLAMYFMSRIDQTIVSRITKYMKLVPLRNIFKDAKVEDGKISLDIIMNLYKWYFTLCKTINNNLDNNNLDSNNLDITKFTNKFNKYIVKTCTAYKTINEKTKKLNTCRKKLI